MSTFGRFRLLTSFESSPVSVVSNFEHFGNHVFRRNDWKVNEMAKNILGENDQIYKNGPGEANGIGDGMYDVHHKLLRYKK